MCWVALDRAIALAGPLDAADQVEAWTQTQARIREAVLTRGWSERAEAFTQSFGSDDLDASSLMVALVGFLPADDPRVRSTIDATEDRLTDRGGWCTATGPTTGSTGTRGRSCCAPSGWPRPWLAGEVARARTVFERAAAFVNDVGLLAEEVDPVSGELLGNFPQAFSHIGLVNAAWAISEAERDPLESGAPAGWATVEAVVAGLVSVGVEIHERERQSGPSRSRCRCSATPWRSSCSRDQRDGSSSGGARPARPRSARCSWWVELHPGPLDVVVPADVGRPGRRGRHRQVIRSLNISVVCVPFVR